MASLGNPRTWVPYMNNKDCSLGFCSLYCPQWCNYALYPPPPPPYYEFSDNDDDDSTSNFSPLVIAIIGVIASAFLLVSYYTIISKYCGRRESSSEREQHHEASVHELEDNHHNPFLHEPWHVLTTTGLDEALIKSITVCKYKKGDGLVEVTTDCSVCLSEFQDGESIRLLPKCSHAFHIPCIDTWLKSNSNCPLCRASIFTFNASSSASSTLPLPLPPTPVIEDFPSRNGTSSENHQHGSENVLGVVEEEGNMMHGGAVPPKPALRAYSDLGNLMGRHHSIVEIIRDEEEYDSFIRSISMDHSFQRGVSVGDVVLHMNQLEQDSQVIEGCTSEAGPSKRSRGESSHRRRVLHCVMSPIAMKRSFSLSRNGRGKQGILLV